MVASQRDMFLNILELNEHRKDHLSIFQLIKIGYNVIQFRTFFTLPECDATDGRRYYNTKLFVHMFFPTYLN